MNNALILWACVGGLLAQPIIGCKPKSESGQVAIENYFLPPSHTNFVLSPSGDVVAYIRRTPDNAALVLQNFTTNQTTTTLLPNADEISFLAFKTSQQLLYIGGKKADKHLYSVDARTQKIVNLTPFKDANAHIIHLFEKNNTEIIIDLCMRKPNLPDAYTLDTRSGNMHLIAQNDGTITQWHADNNGNIRLANAQTEHHTHLLSRNNNQQNFTELFTFCPTDQFKPVFFDGDNQNFYALSNLNRDKIALVKINPANGNETQMVYQNATADVYQCSYSTVQKRISNVSFVHDQLKNQPLTIATQRAYKKISDLLPKNQQFVVISTDANEKNYIIKTYDATTIANYFLYNNNSLVLLYNTNQDQNLPKMCQVTPATIPTCDGLQMQSYLTIPHKKTKDLPFVVLIHRFSEGRATLKYDAAAQYLASRGYGVLQLNFRGATGYGKYYHNLAKKELGKKIDCDIQDGVTWLIQKRYANPKKIAIVGESFGGFCALNCAAQCPETFACAAGYSSTLNLASYVQQLQRQPIATQSRLIESIGHPQDDSLLLLQRSPLHKANSIKTPILLYQNTQHTDVNQYETKLLVDILRRNHVPIVYRLSDNANASEEKIRFYEDTEKFLYAYLRH